MTTRLRNYALLTLLAWVTLWPIAHMALVKSHDLNPWKLGGWGMYAAPQPRPWLDVYRVENGQRQRIDIKQLPPEVQHVWSEHMLDAAYLGALASAQDLANALFAHDPSIGSIEMVHWRARLDPDCDCVVKHERESRFQR